MTKVYASLETPDIYLIFLMFIDFTVPLILDRTDTLGVNYHGKESEI